jgi:hypothetical protein
VTSSSFDVDVRAVQGGAVQGGAVQGGAMD